MRTRELLCKAAIPTACIVALANTACGGDDDPETCRSPRAESAAYPGVTPPNGQKWGAGIIARTTNLPATAAYRGLILGFRNPNDAEAKWRDSHPVPGDRGKEVALYIGSGAVAFSAQFEATAGSDICSIAPVTDFGSSLPFDQLPAAAARPAW